MVLCHRPYQWFTSYREQTGVQRGRECLEYVVTLRLLTDTAKKKKIILFVAFIDFSKAYYLVPRNDLFKILEQLECGRVMLAALAAMYRVSESVLATRGIKVRPHGRTMSDGQTLLPINNEKRTPRGVLDTAHVRSIGTLDTVWDAWRYTMLPYTR